MNKIQLTDSQRHVFDNLTALVAENGRSPTNSELAKRAGITTGHVSNVLRRLAEVGAVEMREVSFMMPARPTKRRAYFPVINK